MRILVPVSTNELDAKFKEWVVSVARKFSAELTLLNVQHSLEAFTYSFPGFAGYPQMNSPVTAEHDERAVEQAVKIAEEAGKILEAEGIGCSAKGLIGDPAESILMELEEGEYDMLVMKARERSDAGRFLLGSITDKVLHHSHIPVLILK